MTIDYVIFGCGSQAAYVIDNLRSHGIAGLCGTVDLEGNLPVPREVDDVPVRWRCQEAVEKLDPASCQVIVAHGDNRLKMRVVAKLQERGFRFLNALHREAIVSATAQVGEGCIVNPGVVLQPRSKLEAHVIVHSGSIIEHDCVVEEGANIAPGVTLAGRVRVGREAYVYTGSSVIPGIRIGARAVVGAGAVVLEDVAEGASVVGNPARRIR